MVDPLQRIVIITKMAWHTNMNRETKLREIKRVCVGEFVFYAGLPGTNKYVTVENATNDLEAEVALEEYGYVGVEYVAHETLWWFPEDHVEVERITFEE